MVVYLLQLRPIQSHGALLVLLCTMKPRLSTTKWAQPYTSKSLEEHMTPTGSKPPILPSGSTFSMTFRPQEPWEQAKLWRRPLLATMTQLLQETHQSQPISLSKIQHPFQELSFSHSMLEDKLWTLHSSTIMPMTTRSKMPYIQLFLHGRTRSKFGETKTSSPLDKEFFSTSDSLESLMQLWSQPSQFTRKP